MILERGEASACAAHMPWRMCHLRPVDLSTMVPRFIDGLLGTTKKNTGPLKLVRALYAPMLSQDDRIVVK